MNRHRPIPLLLALLFAGGLAFAAHAKAQTPVGAAANRQSQRRAQMVNQARAQNQQQGQPNPGERRMMGLPPKWVERLQDMTPQQQERFMRNNERFNSLPPQQQAQIRNRLQVWNNMTPEQREEIRERQRVWEQMTPEQQSYVQNVLLPRWQQLPQQRKIAILNHLRALRALGDADREALLNDPTFMQGMSPDERHMLRDLAHLRVGGMIEPPP
jgi:hypothetical protein